MTKKIIALGLAFAMSVPGTYASCYGFDESSSINANINLKVKQNITDEKIQQTEKQIKEIQNDVKQVKDERKFTKIVEQLANDTKNIGLDILKSIKKRGGNICRIPKMVSRKYATLFGDTVYGLIKTAVASSVLSTPILLVINAKEIKDLQDVLTLVILGAALPWLALGTMYTKSLLEDFKRDVYNAIGSVLY